MIAFGRVLEALNRAGVDYVLVGGLAVGVHGYLRATKDVDVLVPANAEVMQKVRQALEELEATRLDSSPLPEELFSGERHVRARTKYGVIDVIPEGSHPLDYATLRKSAVRSEIQGVEVWVVDLPGLVTLKRLANRPEDRRDLEKLETAQGTLPDSLIDPADLDL